MQTKKLPPIGDPTATRHLAGRVALAVVLCTIAVSLCSWQRLQQPHLWAEDGREFLPRALGSGVASLLLPMAGYYHLLPRLLSQCFVLFPLQYFPALVLIACLLIYAWVAAEVARDDYRWLIPSDSTRMLLALVLCVSLPGRAVVMGNLANLHNVGLVYLGLLAWRDLCTPLTTGQLAWAFLMMGTEGGCVVLLPAFLARLWWMRASDRVIRQREVLCTALLAAWAAAHGAASVAWLHGTPGLRPQEMALGYLRLICERYGAYPVLGAQFVTSVHHHDGWRLWVIGGGLVALLVTVGMRRFGPAALRVAIVPGCILGIYVATWSVRPDTFDFMMRHPGLSMRYSFASAPFGLMLWTAACTRRSRTTLSLCVPGALMCGYGLLALPVWELPPLGPHTDWSLAAQTLERARQQKFPTEVHIPINPRGWNLVYPPPPPG